MLSKKEYEKIGAELCKLATITGPIVPKKVGQRQVNICNSLYINIAEVWEVLEQFINPIDYSNHVA